MSCTECGWLRFSCRQLHPPIGADRGLLERRRAASMTEIIGIDRSAFHGPNCGGKTAAPRLTQMPLATCPATPVLGQKRT